MNDNLNNKLNEYVDGNLNGKELEKLNKIISNDNNVLEKIKSLKTVDNILRNLKVNNAPENFTETIMQKIYSAGRKKNTAGKRFFTFTVSFLVLTILSFTGYGIFTAQHSTAVINGKEILLQANKYFADHYNKISNLLFTNVTLNIFGSAALIIILAFSFAVISHNKLMHKLNTSNS